MLLRIIIISAYALMITVIGIIGLKRTRSFQDFFLAGGKVGPWMTAFTYGTAYFSAVLFIGFAGKIGWNFGYSGIWIAVGNTLVGVLLVWWLLGPRIRRMATDYGVSTMPEYFQKRYRSSFLKLFATIAIFIFLVPYCAAVFKGLSHLFEINFNLPYWVALLFMGTFTALYLSLGGYRSMTMLDVVFGIIMCGGVLLLLFFTLTRGGGLGRITSELQAISPALIRVVGPPGFWPLFSLVFLTSVAPLAMPQLVQKFYAIKDQRSIRIGMVGSTGFALLVVTIAYFTGAASRVFLNPLHTPLAFEKGQPVYDKIIPVFLGNVIPNSLLVIILLLILSASMSTLAALVLISSSSIAKDFVAGYVNRDISDRNLTLLMRACSVLFVVVSVVIAYFQPATIVFILSISWGAIGSVFLGPFIWGLFTRFSNKYGALSSAILGLGSCLFLSFQGMPPPQSGTIGMLVSLAVNPLVSLLTRSRVHDPVSLAGGKGESR